jgi:hypothetical protein
MSELLNTLYGGYYANRLTGTTAGALLPVDERIERKPQLGQVDSASGAPDIAGGYGFSSLCGYNARSASSPALYLSLLLDPVLAAARMFALNPIRIGRAKLAKVREDAPDDWKQPLEDMTKPLLTPYVEDGVWGVDMGWAGFQNVWERRDGLFWLADVIACRQEADSGILVDKGTGNKVGVRWNGVDLQGHKCFSYTHDRRGQQWLGRSRLENVLEAIENWRELNSMTAKMGRKAGGVVVMTGYPPGADATKAAANKTLADAFGRAITSGAAYGSYPTLGGLTEDKIKAMAPADIVKLAEMSLWQFKILDLGDPGTSISSTTEEKRYLDELKCLGYGVPPQAILHGTFGARADTASKGGSGTAMNESVNKGVYDAFNQGALNSILELNYGKEARDSYRWEPEPLEDQQSVFDREILKMVAQSDAGMAYLSKRFQLDAIAERNGLPKRTEDAKPDDVIQPVAVAQPGAQGGAPGGFDIDAMLSKAEAAVSEVEAMA